MTSGPIMVQVLESENAVQRNCDIMGATNPGHRLAGTCAPTTRTATANAVHGSDSVESAQREIIATSSTKSEICAR